MFGDGESVVLWGEGVSTFLINLDSLMPFGKELRVVSGTRQEEIRILLWGHFRIGFNDNRLSAEI